MEALDQLNPIHRISVAQFHRMIDAGVFSDGDRVELIDGEMRDMTPIGPPHRGCTDALSMYFSAKLAGKAIVSTQGPFGLDEGNELYPDLQILKLSDDWYRETNPTGADTYLVIEVADSSLEYDRTIKLAKYARAGVRRYWVVDVPNRTIHDYRDPDRFGQRYRQLHSVTSGELPVSIEGVECRIEIGYLFGR